MPCESCGAPVSDVDVRCGECGGYLASTGAQRMLGTKVLGQYEITDILGQGGMSVVYLGRHHLTEQKVALKILPPELAAHSQLKSRFVEEARALAALDHANIVHLYNFGEENGCFVLVMQFVEGETLERMILDAETLPWAVALPLAIDVLEALEYAHQQGVIHRDMKPSNILVRAQNGTATVMDFGIAKMTNSTKLTATGQTMGTVRYMSPEQVRGKDIDHRTDIYSLGASLYEALTGDTPFDGETHFEIMSKQLHEEALPVGHWGIECPDGVNRAVLRSMEKDPAKRFQSAREFRLALASLLQQASLGTEQARRISQEMVAATVRARAMPTAHPQAAVGPRGDRTAATPIATTDSDASLATAGARSQLPPSPTRRRLWLVLAIALVAAGAGFGAWQYLHRDGGELAPTVAPAKSPSVWPKNAFVPSQSQFTVDDIDAERRLRVLSHKIPAARVYASVDTATDSFVAFLRKRKLFGPDMARPPITVAVVPQGVFCDRNVYIGATDAVEEAFAQCRGSGYFYRPDEATLLVLDQQDALESHIALGLSEIACVEWSLQGCATLLEQFRRELANSR